MEYSYYLSDPDPNKGESFYFKHGMCFLKKFLDLIKPRRYSKGGPALCLLDRGRLVEKLFRPTDELPNIMIGKLKTGTLIFIYNSNEIGFDLFRTDLPQSDVREKLLAGKMNESLYQARIKGENRAS